MIASAAFGYITFRRRIKGVYFALITQALVLAVYTFVVNQQPYTGGVVGMTNLDKLHLFGVTFHMEPLFYLVAGVLAVCFLGCYVLMRGKFGKVLTGIRDSEFRVLALGYDTATYKTFVFALAGALAGLAGALYASVLGTTGPDNTQHRLFDPDRGSGGGRRPGHPDRGDHRRRPGQLRRNLRQRQF